MTPFGRCALLDESGEGRPRVLEKGEKVRRKRLTTKARPVKRRIRGREGITGAKRRGRWQRTALGQ